MNTKPRRKLNVSSNRPHKLTNRQFRNTTHEQKAQHRWRQYHARNSPRHTLRETSSSLTAAQADAMAESQAGARRTVQARVNAGAILGFPNLEALSRNGAHDAGAGRSCKIGIRIEHNGGLFAATPIRYVMRVPILRMSTNSQA